MVDGSISFCGAVFQPLACGALFWPAEQTLLAADLHLEKGSSLARDGWLLPPYDSVETLDRLLVTIGKLTPRRLILLGDSFHDRQGPSRLPDNARARLAALAQAANLVWIAGNHDGLSTAELPGTSMEAISLSGIRMVHEPQDAGAAPAIAGHFHPKVKISLGHGRTARRRCFALGPRAMILPAFGAYAGGMDVFDPAIATACGGPVTAILASSAGLLRLLPGRGRPIAEQRAVA